MLCVCYRIESPVVKRPQEEKLQASFCTKAKLHYEYLYEATNYNYVYPLVVTSHVGALKDKLLSTSSPDVSVEVQKDVARQYYVLCYINCFKMTNLLTYTSVCTHSILLIL